MPPEATPTVSVVLPAFNRVASIGDAIDSVLRQTWADFELIVVDDGSTDGTRAAAEAIEDPRLRVLSTGDNRGPSGARNAGVAAARGTWVAFQDSDDSWLPEKLARQMARLTEPGADWVAAYCGMAIVGNVIKTGRGRVRVRYIPNPEIEDVEGDIHLRLLRSSLVSTQMLVARRDALQAIGGFDEALFALEDWDLALRLSRQGPFAFVDEPLVMQRFPVGDAIIFVSTGHRIPCFGSVRARSPRPPGRRSAARGRRPRIRSRTSRSWAISASPSSPG